MYTPWVCGRYPTVHPWVCGRYPTVHPWVWGICPVCTPWVWGICPVCTPWVMGGYTLLHPWVRRVIPYYTRGLEGYAQYTPRGLGGICPVYTPWVWYLVYTLGYMSRYTLPGTPASPPALPARQRRLHHCPATEPWAQGGRFSWVRASLPAKVLKSVMVDRHLCAECSALPHEKE